MKACVKGYWQGGGGERGWVTEWGDVVELRHWCN